MYRFAMILAVAACLAHASSANGGLSWSPPTSCKNVEKYVYNVLKEAVAKDPFTAPPLTALHFVDCMVNGCDGSAMLAGSGTESSAVFFLDGFNLMNKIKEVVDEECGAVVSCADLLTIAARDVVGLFGGPYWKVQFGRLDGKLSTAQAAAAWIPRSSSKVDSGVGGAPSLATAFSYLKLTSDDLVALSGGHTLGRADCTGTADRRVANPTTPISHKLKTYLVNTCKADSSAEFDMSLGPKGKLPPSGGLVFDNAYYKNIVKKMGVLNSDQALFYSDKTKKLVTKFANDQDAFFKAFAKAMVKMAAITPSSLKQMPGGPSVPVYPNNEYGIRKGKCTVA